MVRELMHDPEFLSKVSEPATPEDIQVGEDLMETLLAHKERCVGMGANMIGVCKRIIVFKNGEIVERVSGAYPKAQFEAMLDKAL